MLTAGNAVVAALDQLAAQKHTPLTVGLCLGSQGDLVKQLVTTHHQVVVAGTRFHQLRKIHPLLAPRPGCGCVEVARGEAPFAGNRLDALVVTWPLLPGPQAVTEMTQLGRQLKSGGLFCLISPVHKGWLGRLGLWRRKMTWPREQLCLALLKSGYVEIGQQRVQFGRPFAHVLTFGQRR